MKRLFIPLAFLIIACDYDDITIVVRMEQDVWSDSDATSSSDAQVPVTIITEKWADMVEHPYIPTDLADVPDADITLDDTAVEDTTIPTEEVFTETLPCTEDWHCASGKDCTPDGQCVSRDVLIYVLSGYDGSPPPAHLHDGEEITIIFGREPWEKTGVIPYSEWLPLGELCESGYWIELRDPRDPSYGYGNGCVTLFKNVTTWQFLDRLTYSIVPSQDPARCPELLYVAKTELEGCDDP